MNRALSNPRCWCTFDALVLEPARQGDDGAVIVVYGTREAVYALQADPPAEGNQHACRCVCMGMRQAAVIVAVIAMAGCSSGDKAVPQPTTTLVPETTIALSRQQRATLQCKRALRHEETFATAQPTTVGAMYRITGPFGRASHPWSYLYEGQPDDAFAAWCWRSTGAQSYQSYVVGPGEPIFLNVYTNGVDAAPVGPMAVT